MVVNLCQGTVPMWFPDTVLPWDRSPLNRFFRLGVSVIGQVHCYNHQLNQKYCLVKVLLIVFLTVNGDYMKITDPQDGVVLWVVLVLFGYYKDMLFSRLVQELLNLLGLQKTGLTNTYPANIFGSEYETLFLSRKFSIFTTALHLAVNHLLSLHKNPRFHLELKSTLLHWGTYLNRCILRF